MPNSAFDLETVYSPEGEPVTVSRLNAIDLIRTAGYSWKSAPVETPAEPKTDVEPEAPAAPVEIEPPVLDAVVDAKTDDLADVAHAIVGAGTEAYLNGFSVDALKTMAMERFGEKLRANVSKEKAIERIMELEAAKEPASDE